MVAPTVVVEVVGGPVVVPVVVALDVEDIDEDVEVAPVVEPAVVVPAVVVPAVVVPAVVVLVVVVEVEAGQFADEVYSVPPLHVALEFWQRLPPPSRGTQKKHCPEFDVHVGQSVN